MATAAARVRRRVTLVLIAGKHVSAGVYIDPLSTVLE
jgi:hypothetical protein